MKIIFLDIDGVLNSSDWAGSFEFKKKQAKGLSFPDTHLDNVAIQRVDELCKRTGAKVVISSTWREFEYCVPALRRNGFRGEIIGKTPDLDKKLDSGIWTSKTRGEEIQAWLDQNECDSYVIIDDDSDMLDSQKENFVHTNFMHGFTGSDIESAVEIFEKVEELNK